MKKDDENLDDYLNQFDNHENENEECDWYPDGYQGRSKNQIKNNARTGGCVVVLFVIALVWYIVYELINWLF